MYTGEEVEEEGPLEPSKPREEVKQDPYPLGKDFEWSTVDLTDAAQVRIALDCSESILISGTSSLKKSMSFFPRTTSRTIKRPSALLTVQSSSNGSYMLCQSSQQHLDI